MISIPIRMLHVTDHCRLDTCICLLDGMYIFATRPEVKYLIIVYILATQRFEDGRLSSTLTYWNLLGGILV
jgi:hypothetical protein